MVKDNTESHHQGPLFSGLSFSIYLSFSLCSKFVYNLALLLPSPVCLSCFPLLNSISFSLSSSSQIGNSRLEKLAVSLDKTTFLPFYLLFSFLLFSLFLLLLLSSSSSFFFYLFSSSPVFFYVNQNRSDFLSYYSHSLPLVFFFYFSFSSSLNHVFTDMSVSLLTDCMTEPAVEKPKGKYCPEHWQDGNGGGKRH